MTAKLSPVAADQSPTTDFCVATDAAGGKRGVARRRSGGGRSRLGLGIALAAVTLISTFLAVRTHVFSLGVQIEREEGGRGGPLRIMTQQLNDIQRATSYSERAPHTDRLLLNGMRAAARGGGEGGGRGGGGAGGDAAPLHPLCVRMPTSRQLRILMVALPPEAFTITGGVDAVDDGALTMSSQPMELSPLAAYINNMKALWSYTEGLSRRSGDIELGRVPTLASVRDSLIDNLRYLGAGQPAIATDSTALQRAVNGTALLMTPLQRAAEAWVFSTVDPLDLERIVIAGFMTSPYVHIVDGRNITPDMLRDADYVFVPFPLANMKGRPSVLRK